MKIGEASAITGLSCKAIRLYEQQGLIKPARKGKYRSFNSKDIDLLLLIGEARRLEIPLARLRSAIKDADRPDWPAVRIMLTELQQETEHEIAAQQQRLHSIGLCLAELHQCPLQGINSVPDLDSAP